MKSLQTKLEVRRLKRETKQAKKEYRQLRLTGADPEAIQAAQADYLNRKDFLNQYKNLVKVAGDEVNLELITDHYRSIDDYLESQRK